MKFLTYLKNGFLMWWQGFKDIFFPEDPYSLEDFRKRRELRVNKEKKSKRNGKR